MDATFELILGIITSLIGLYILIEGWMIVERKKSFYPFSLRWQVQLTKCFQGKKVAERVKEKIASPKAIHSYGVWSLILGTATLVASLFLILEAWMKLRS